MKLRRYLSAFAAASVAVSAISVASFAAPVLTVNADTAATPSDNIIKTADDGKIDLAKVKTVKVTITSTIDGNLGIGCNNAADGKWTQVDGNFKAGTQTYELNVDGISIDEKENFVVMVGIWWMNGAGTLTVDSIEMLDANGKVPEVVVVSDDKNDEAKGGSFEADCAYSKTAPAASFKVVDDLKEVKVSVDIKPAGDGFDGFNDWCGQGVRVTYEDGTVKYYQWGGAQVSWGWDIDDDKVDESVGGVKGDTWIGTVSGNSAELTIPVAKNAVVDFYCLSWDTFSGTQYTIKVAGGVASVDDVTDPVVPDEPVVEETEEVVASTEEVEVTDEYNGTVEVDIDIWDAYDADAMAEMNENFKLGVNDQIDIYDLVGDAWTDLAKVEGTFVWTPGLGGWCGGGGIGGGAVLEDGSEWFSGPEYGAANFNADLEPNGTATQTIIDITNNPISAIATYNEETGEVSFGKIFVQNWWNGVEAGAQLAAITAYDADGNVIGEISYDVEVPEAPASGDNTGDDDNGSTENPDTGVAGVAVAAGVVALAGAAVVVSRKRK